MFAAISPSSSADGPDETSATHPRIAGPAAACLQRSHGRLRVRLAQKDGATRLADLFQEGCLQARLPKTPDRQSLDVALINLAGGLTGGDHVTTEIGFGADTTGAVTTQAAEKLYRAAEGVSRIDQHLSVGAGAWCEWLPQETILFDGAHLDRRLRIDLAPTGRLLMVEPLVFGRQAMGETVSAGSLVDRLEIRIADNLVWQDQTRLMTPLGDRLGCAAVLRGQRACATLMLLSPGADAWTQQVRQWLTDFDVFGGASFLDPLLLVRLVSADPLALRRAVAFVITELRTAIAGLPPVLPRLWQS